MKIGDLAGRGESIDPIFDYIEESVATLLPEFMFSIAGDSPPYELYRYPSDESPPVIAQPDQLSSGEAELLTLALDLLTICNIWVLEGQPQRLLLVDEPDTHLHPDLQVRLAQFLVQLLDRFDAQLIVATHSTTLLSSIGHFGKEGVGVVYLNNSQSEQKVRHFNKVLRELSTVLGGHALMGPLFGAPILLVEGDDDYKIWSQVPRHPAFQGSLAVIPCDGQEIYDYQDKLESLFASIRESGQSPAGYALLDGDARLPTHAAQKHVKFLMLDCSEAENLYVSAEGLNRMGHTWAQAKVLIKAKAENYGNHAEKLLTCDGWERATEDIKEVINSLADILDEKKLPWTLRVGKTIGERPPVGELADFLGSGIVEALWNSQHSD